MTLRGGPIRRIGDGSIIQRIQALFEGHPDLLNKFKVFLPQDSGIDLSRGQVVSIQPPQQGMAYDNSIVYAVLRGTDFLAISRRSSVSRRITCP